MARTVAMIGGDRCSYACARVRGGRDAASFVLLPRRYHSGYNAQGMHGSVKSLALSGQVDARGRKGTDRKA